MASDRDARLEEARQACLAERYETAYSIYEDLLQRSPSDTETLRSYGRAKYRAYHDLDQAADLFARALALAPDSIDSILWLAELSSMGYGPGYKAAADLYHRAIALDPKAVDAYIGLGMLIHTPSKSVSQTEAIAAFREAVRLDPDRADAHLDLAMALLEAGERQEARAELLDARALLEEAGNRRMSEAIEATIQRLDRGERITSTLYRNLSPRFRWPEDA